MQLSLIHWVVVLLAVQMESVDKRQKILEFHDKFVVSGFWLVFVIQVNYEMNI